MRKIGIICLCVLLGSISTHSQTQGLQIGQPALDFTQNDNNDRPISLRSFRGKYVLLEFWASWCVPCRIENPNLVALYKQYRGQGFEILSVSLDEDKDAWVKAISKDKLPWPQLSDLMGNNNQVAKLYNVKGVPHNYLIDPEGVVVATQLKQDVLARELGKIFAKAKEN